MTRVWLVTLFGAAAGLSCGNTTVTPLTQLNLDRPVDIAFACYGPLRVAGALTATAQPSTWCDALSPQITGGDPPAPAGQNPADGIPDWYGFILQSASGTVAVARWAAKPSDQFLGGFSTNLGDVVVLDADPRTPGKNAISVGEDPIAIVTDKTGCYEVTANAGSCDLSVLDINSVLTTNVSTQVNVVRKTVTNGNGIPIRAKPTAMVVEPNAGDILDPNGIPACTTQPLGMATPAGRAYITYPGCNLVAAVDLDSGQIKGGIQYVNGVPTRLSEAAALTITCADECNGAVATPDVANEVRPVTLSLQVDARAKTRRLAIGANNAASITVVDLDPAFAPATTPPLQVALEDTLRKPGDTTSKLAVTSVALSPQIAMGNSATQPRHNNNSEPLHASVGGEAQYVYAVATDGTVRVADVLGDTRPPTECDTQIDTRLVRAIASDPKNIPLLQCFPVGAPTNPPRRTGAKGPGIELPVDGVPTSVTFIKGLDQPHSTTVAATATTPMVTTEDPPSPGMLIGYFAIVTVTSGQVYLVNVDDDDGPDLFVPDDPTNASDASSLRTAPMLVMAHQLRDAYGQRDAPAAAGAHQCSAVDPTSAITGGPRATSKPGPIIPVTTLPAAKLSELPILRQEQCLDTDTTVTPTTTTPVTVSELQLGATAALRDQVFPDLRNVVPDTWTMSWEGTLSNDSAITDTDGPAIRNGQMIVDRNGMRLIDQTRPFCEMGVEPFDIVQFRGCNPSNLNADCPSGYTCFASDQNQVANLGACILTSEASRLAVSCGDFLTTARRYTVGRADSGQLTLLPRKHVLATTPIDGCTSDAQCKTLANYAAVLRSANQPSVLSDPDPAHAPDKHSWGCAVDPLRAPLNDDPLAKRCIETCITTVDCEVGTICVGGTGGPDGKTPDGTCMESVLPSQSCVNGPQRFEVHASEAFTAIGVSSGYIHPIIERSGVRPPDPNADPNKAHECIRDPNASRLQIGRIPLHAPACAAPGTVNEITGELLTGRGFEPNPCSLTVAQADDQPNYLPGTCTASSPTTTIEERQAPAIKVRMPSMTLTMVDPYSPGDLTCIQDRQGGLGKIPLLLQAPFNVAFTPGYQIIFAVKAGFTPQPIGVGSLFPAFPVKVVRGPSESIWVMDDGDFLATQLGQSSTRGQVFRVDSTNLGRVNTLQ